jgi:small subunit ribosomal protein S6
MNNYNLAIILPGAATAAKKKAITGKIEKMVKEGKGKIGKIDDWGEKPLAYPIKKNNSGTYLIFPLELESATAADINGKLRLDEEIIRYLLVKDENGKKS